VDSAVEDLGELAFRGSAADLIATARTNSAPQEIIEVLRKLPKDEFGSPQDVMKAYGELDESEHREN
jgi:hypothetical protein